MSALSNWIVFWPQMPPLPPPGKPVLMCVSTRPDVKPEPALASATPGPARALDSETAAAVFRESAPDDAGLRNRTRQEVRLVLRQILAAWSGLPPDRLPLIETPRGPVWEGKLAGHSLDISLSYSGHESWIGIRRAGAIGLDVMLLEYPAEIQPVARLYLGPTAWDDICNSTDPASAFILAWTAMEARLKCFKQPLTEWPGNQPAQLPPGMEECHYLDDHRVVAVATYGA